MMESNLEVDMNRRSQRTASAQTSRVFSGSRTTDIQRGFPSGVRIKPMSMTAVEKTQANHFLKLGCAKLIRPIYAQLHRSNSPSYRRAVWEAWWLWSGVSPTCPGSEPWTRPGSWNGTRRRCKSCCSCSQRFAEPEVVRKSSRLR